MADDNTFNLKDMLMKKYYHIVEKISYEDYKLLLKKDLSELNEMNSFIGNIPIYNNTKYLQNNISIINEKKESATYKIIDDMKHIMDNGFFSSYDNTLLKNWIVNISLTTQDDYT